MAMERRMLGLDMSWSKGLPRMNNQPRSKPLVSTARAQRKETGSASLFSNFNASSLLPSADLDSFNNAHFGLFGRCDGLFTKTRKDRSTFLPVDVANRAGPGQSRRHLSDRNAAPGRANVLQLSACHAEVSVSSSRSRRTVEEIMRTTRVDHNRGIKPAADLPLASTAGRVDGEFWKERREVASACNFQPSGTLYTSSGGDGVQNYWELPRGKSLQGNIRIDQNHSVSTGCEQGSRMDEKSIWLSTSHKLGVNHALVTQFENDQKGGNTFSVNSTHNFTPNATVFSNLYTNSFGESSLEVELQREKKRGNQEVFESIMANLRTGDRQIKLQSKNMLKEIMLMSSLVSNFRRQHELKFMTTIPFRQSGSVSSSLAMDLCGNQKFTMNAMQKIHDQIVIGASLMTNLKQQDAMSVEAKHQLDGLGTLVLKLTNDLCSSRVDVTTSITTKRNSWLWAFRNVPAEGRSLKLEWRRQISPEHFFSLQAAAKDWTCALLAEMYLPC